VEAALQIKICGVTRPKDAVAAADAGADAIGLVMWSGSKRAVTLAQARAVCEVVPPFLTVTALLVDPEPSWVEEILTALPVNLLQFHGNETPEFCERWAVPYIRALRAEPGRDLVAEAQRYPAARGFLVDAVHDGQFGGTGQTFDWALLPQHFDRPLILAGGLHVDNVAAGIEKLRPVAVDVSSGVETAPGIKDEHKMRAFINAARAAAQSELL